MKRRLHVKAEHQLREEIEAEEKARKASEEEKESMPELPSPEEMPRTPEPLPTPSSLGGLADRAGVEASVEDLREEENGDLQGLRERTGEVSEDLVENQISDPIDEESAKITQELGSKEELH